ncbi:MAG: sulfite exporter TauE/SafE family protein [Candidatus Auribacterota bacterium]|jgi:uncharacterized membrane protein YfcA|nr:sulfite exporter TauE/SafE family protein [Candidatus Auribacterota bacterium]
MSIIVICAVALVASCLTFFSGFGLGTILMPAFLLFFPIDTAIALTAVVHLLNNVLKLIILFKKAEWNIVFKFGAPAFVSSYLGAKALFMLEGVKPLLIYELFGREMTVTPVKLTLAVVIASFVVFESLPLFKRISFPPEYLPAGGFLSGFFGGLSGHQGALRSMFLLKCGLDKEAYIATGVIIACLVDFSRIFVYWGYLMKSQYQDYSTLMILAVLSAFTGVFAGSRLMKKITMATVQVIVSIMLLAISILLGFGII